MRDYSEEELTKGIDQWITGKNAERNRIILKMRLIHGYTYEQIAECLHVNEDLPERYKLGVKQISRVISEGSIKLFNHI